jgi:hypothetical protein
MYSVIAVVLLALALYLVVKVVKGVNEKVDDSTGDSGLTKSEVSSKPFSVDDDFKAEPESMYEQLEPLSVVKKKKPAAKKKTASKKKKAE